MFKKIRNKICMFICQVFNIIPCMCSHECKCKKAHGNKLDEGI